jgi:hypothetical protein
MKPSQGKPLGNFQFWNVQQQAPKPNAPPRNVGYRRCFNCGQPGITSAIAPNPSRSSPTHQIKVQGTNLPLRLRSLWCKYAKAS